MIFVHLLYEEAHKMNVSSTKFLRSGTNKTGVLGICTKNCQASSSLVHTGVWYNPYLIWNSVWIVLWKMV